MREDAFRRQVLKRLREIPGSVWTSLHGGGWQTPGLPDILGVVRGRAVFIELKRPGRYKDPVTGLRPAQRAWLTAAVRAGAVVIIADRWETIQSGLEGILGERLANGANLEVRAPKNSGKHGIQSREAARMPGVPIGTSKTLR